MGTDKAVVTISFVNRYGSPLGDSQSGQVSRIQRGGNNSRWMTVVYEDRGAIVINEIHMGLFHITSVTIAVESRIAHACSYSNAADSQDRAFEDIEKAFARYDVHTDLARSRKEEDVAPSSGPKRLEVTLKGYGQGSYGEKKIVVTDLVPPENHFRFYNISGRIWDFQRRSLNKNSRTFTSSAYNIIRVDRFFSPATGIRTNTSHYNNEDQERAWAELKKSWNMFRPYEIRLITEWEVGEDDSDEDAVIGERSRATNYGSNRGPYGSHHWTNSTPTAYKPKTAVYRVAGDAEGATLHRKQQEQWQKEHGCKSSREVLEEKLAKKAGKGEETEASSSPEESSSESAEVAPLGSDLCSKCFEGSECFAGACANFSLGSRGKSGYLH